VKRIGVDLPKQIFNIDFPERFELLADSQLCVLRLIDPILAFTCLQHKYLGNHKSTESVESSEASDEKRFIHQKIEFILWLSCL
jgi:hypothetical protein